MKRKLLLFFCVLSCVLMVSGCSLVRGNENFDKKTLEQQTDNFLTSWFAADFEGTISTYKDQMNDTTLAQYKLYAKQKSQYKGLKKKNNQSLRSPQTPLQLQRQSCARAETKFLQV